MIGLSDKATDGRTDRCNEYKAPHNGCESASVYDLINIPCIYRYNAARQATMVVSTATSSNGNHAGASVSGGLENDIMQGTMPGARRRGRPRTAWMDNIKTWTGLPVEESVRMTEDKWRKYVHGVANPRIEDGYVLCADITTDTGRYAHEETSTHNIGATALCDPWDASPQLWRSCRGPSVFGHLQLLQLTLVFFAGQSGQPNKFPASLLAVFKRKGKTGVGE